MKQALQFALRKLTRTSYYSARLFSMMKEAGIEENESNEALSYLKELKLIDDEDYIRQFVAKWQKRGKSRQEIFIKARLQKIPSQLIAPLIREEKGALVLMIEKRYPQLLDKECPIKIKQKAIMALTRKGFPFHLILDVLNNYMIELS
jgi:SOS response regulatory protein OraA/RecX